jgi:hypothetical protein
LYASCYDHLPEHCSSSFYQDEGMPLISFDHIL